MLKLNLEKFYILFKEKEEYGYLQAKNEHERKKDMFFSVVCEKESLKDFEDFSCEDLIDTMSCANDYVTGNIDVSSENVSIIESLVKGYRVPQRRLL